MYEESHLTRLIIQFFRFTRRPPCLETIGKAQVIPEHQPINDRLQHYAPSALTPNPSLEALERLAAYLVTVKAVQRRDRLIVGVRINQLVERFLVVFPEHYEGKEADLRLEVFEELDAAAVNSNTCPADSLSSFTASAPSRTAATTLPTSSIRKQVLRLISAAFVAVSNSWCCRRCCL